MTEVVLELVCECELVHDAIEALLRAHVALTRRHGSVFRALERDIERLTEGADLTLADPHYLGEGRFVFEPPKELSDLVARARAIAII